MRVFKACWSIVRRRSAALILYFIIFLILSVIMTLFSVEQYSTEFTETKSTFTIINRDRETALIQSLRDYLLKHGEEVPLEDQKEKLQDATFYHASDYILIVPSGFHDSLLAGAPLPLETVTIPDSAKGYYLDSLVNQYWNLVQIHHTLEPEQTPNRWASAALEDLAQETAVTKINFGGKPPVHESYEIYSRMECYILMVLTILCVSTILMAFRRPDLAMRNLCSPAKPRSVSGQKTACAGLVCLAAWLLFTALGLALYGSNLNGTDRRIIALVILNTFVFLLVALSLAMLASTFVRSSNVQNAIANFLSLGLCFLGGVFVPLELLGKSMLLVSRFTPTYWYVTALGKICDLTSWKASALAPIWQAMLIQLGFAAAIFCVSLVLAKQRTQSEQAFGSIKTELEA